MATVIPAKLVLAKCKSYTHSVDMATEDLSDPKIRKNVSLRKSVIAIGDGLVETIPKSSFSQLLTDLIMEARNRTAPAKDKYPERNLDEFVQLLTENRKLKESRSKWKGSYRSMTDRAVKYQIAFEEANRRLDAAHKIADPCPPRAYPPR
jgi:hypothetical protein